MRENRTSGSEGGEAQTNELSLPLSLCHPVETLSVGGSSVVRTVRRMEAAPTLCHRVEIPQSGRTLRGPNGSSHGSGSYTVPFRRYMFCCNLGLRGTSLVKRIAITGATGFIGSHLTQHFVSQGWKVLGLCRWPPDGEQNPGVEFVPYDLGKPVPEDALAGCDVLVHCAHVLYSPRQRDADRLNIEGSRHLFRAAERASVGKVLYLSSLSAHSEVQSHYAKSKLAVESLLNPERDTILRLGLVLGPGGFAGRLQAVLARTRIVPLIDAGRQPVYSNPHRGFVPGRAVSHSDCRFGNPSNRASP